VQLSHPPLNIIDIEMMHELALALEATSPARIVQFEAGECCRAFSAGVDVADHTPERVEEMLSAFHAIFRRLYRAEFLTLAVVRGTCLGGGAELACFCDYVIASPDASFGFPEIKLGCFPPIASILLPGFIGLRGAMKMILTGNTLTAKEAKELCLINEVVPADRLEESATNIRGRWLELPGTVLPIARRALLPADFEQRLQAVERLYLGELMGTEEAREGIKAFIEKRPPMWLRAEAMH
jgi:cyclohexa-1,5-dienecarbonyl-CoA hydratase